MDLPGVTGSPPGIVLRSTRAGGALIEDLALSLTRTAGDRFTTLPLLAIPDAIPRSDITFASPQDIEVIRCRAGGQIELFPGAPISRAGNLRVPVRGRVLNYCSLTITGASPNPATDLTVANRVFAQCGVELRRTTLANVTNSALLDIAQTTCPLTIGGDTNRGTEETALFALGRSGAGACASNFLVYYVRSNSLALRGCSAFPVGQPGVHVADSASQYTMAHEIGHVLGLAHVTSGTGAAVNLMIGAPAGNTGSLPANNANVQLTRNQCNTVVASGLVTFVGG
jgi:hypothetical protein